MNKELSPRDQPMKCYVLLITLWRSCRYFNLVMEPAYSTTDLYYCSSSFLFLFPSIYSFLLHCFYLFFYFFDSFFSFVFVLFFFILSLAIWSTGEKWLMMDRLKFYPSHMILTWFLSIVYPWDTWKFKRCRRYSNETERFLQGWIMIY